MVFFLLIFLFGSRFPDMGSDRGLLPAVIRNTKIICQLYGGFSARQSEQAGNKINCIAVCLAGETMETLIDFHAGVAVIVERADRHAVPADPDSVYLCRLPGGNGLLDRFKYIHCILLSGNKKAPDIFAMKTASALEFHILFFLLRSFRLWLAVLLFLDITKPLFDGVLRLWFLFDLGLIRREDFANPVANILHRL